MQRRGSLLRRTRAEWGVRIILALLVVMSGYVGVRHSVADVTKRSDPARAHALAPGDGRITALLAEKLLVDDQRPAAQAAITQMAQRALRQDVTAVQAVVTLGLQAQMRNDVAKARQLFAYAQTLSRRDLQSQLWAIEDAVARNDIPAALRHYDIALTTTKSAPDILFPILTAALSERAVRQSLVAVFARHPIWAPGFIAYAAGSTGDPPAVAALLRALVRTGFPVSATAQTGVVNNLIVRGSFDEGWRYYASVRPGADRRRSRDIDFTADLETPSLLDWIPVNDAGITTSIRERVFDFGVPPSIGGVLLKQMQMLPAGTYRLDGQSREIEQAASALPYWVLTCQNGRELGRVIVPNSARSKGRFAGRFVVPSDCPVQTLSLVARASDDIAGVSGQIQYARLAPVT